MSASNSDKDPNEGPGKGNEDPGKGNEGPGKGKISVRKKKAESVEEKLRRIAAERQFRENEENKNQMFPDEEVGQGVKRKGSRKFKTSTSIKKTRPLDLDELLNLAENLNGDGDDDDDPQFMEAIGIIDQRTILIQELQNTIRELELK
jgi:hypothetical protein